MACVTELCRGYKIKRHGINAIALAGGFRAIVKNMAQMRSAALAVNLRAKREK
jgi:hypothetical protein